MNIYKIEAKMPCRNVMVDFGAKLNSKLSSELWKNSLSGLDEGFGQFLNINGDSQVDNFGVVLNSSDFLSCVVPFPIFSKRAAEVLKIVDGLSFVDVGIDGFFDFCIGIINDRVHFIDEEKSRYRPLSNGDLIISDFAYLEPLRDFYIARDKEHNSQFVVSDAFVELCFENKLEIQFKKIEYGKAKSFFDR
ncbi:hypothetical protein L2728_18150 [Shewanella chilikensis]|uniref:Uncharacterized protein n=1 Tax=Shewanella chilikensis TaxID=558541 RepID=A0ABX5PHA0_9GAMM|nr:hypothetical protein [Shewanella chilikensis]MCA0951675.1 hypothetical protein [Shewanella chilikensis]MCL1155870.1 hypothetical protein [Shewanella chilikensis]MCL1163781.1 hypothetical protein [Shewanella chilikensis]PYE53005.1 hypothetical protein C8J23_1852 [Shewanella chilikensis]GGZ48245.1 hypothetical protein GCM10007105_37740 [Shewanella chilikensis]